MNNAGQTPKNIRITQVGEEMSVIKRELVRELAPTWGFFDI